MSFDEDKKDLLVVRRHIKEEPKEKAPQLKLQTIENAKKILGRNFDVYAVQADWLKWTENRKPPKSWDAAFIGFCKIQIA